MAFALTQEDFAKGLLDKEATGLIEQHMYNPREQERINRGDVIEEGLGGPVEEQAFLGLGDLWNNLKDKAKENERLRQEWREENPGGNPGMPYDLKLKEDQKNKYPGLRTEPQEFSKKDVNKKVAEVVSNVAQKLVEDNPGLAGLNNDYIANGTGGRMAQEVFNRPDRTRDMSNQEMIELLKRVGINDVSPWENPPAERTWKDKGYPYPGFEENTQENIRRSQGYTDDNNNGSTADEYLDYRRIIDEVKEKGDRLGWEKGVWGET